MKSRLCAFCSWRLFGRNRFSEFQEAEFGIGAGGYLEKQGNGPTGVQESSVICDPEIPRGYKREREALV